MSRKSFIEQACELVPEFGDIGETFLRKYTVAEKSSSCIRNYLMQISNMVNFHPHLHFIVPAGGIDQNGQWKHSKQTGSFLYKSYPRQKEAPT